MGRKFTKPEGASTGFFSLLVNIKKISVDLLSIKIYIHKIIVSFLSPESIQLLLVVKLDYCLCILLPECVVFVYLQ